MYAPFSAKKMHRVARIDTAAREHFDQHSDIEKVAARELMTLFISKGIFVYDHNKGGPVHLLLRELRLRNQLHSFTQVRVYQSNTKVWYFRRVASTK